MLPIKNHYTKISGKMETNKAVVFLKHYCTWCRYHWPRYLYIRVLKDMINGYINVTKMCAMYGKQKVDKPNSFAIGHAAIKHSSTLFLHLLI